MSVFYGKLKYWKIQKQGEELWILETMWKGDGGGKEGNKGGKAKSKTFKGHKNRKLFIVDNVYDSIFNWTNIQYILAGKFILHTVMIYSDFI